MKQPHKIKFEIFGIQKQVTIEAENFQEAVQTMIASLENQIKILPEDAKQEEKPKKKLNFFQRILEKLSSPMEIDDNVCSEPYA